MTVIDTLLRGERVSAATPTLQENRCHTLPVVCWAPFDIVLESGDDCLPSKLNEQLGASAKEICPLAIRCIESATEEPIELQQEAAAELPLELKADSDVALTVAERFRRWPTEAEVDPPPGGCISLVRRAHIETACGRVS